MTVHGRSAEPLATNWDGNTTNEWNMGVKHIQAYLNSNIKKLVKMHLPVETKTKMSVS